MTWWWWAVRVDDLEMVGEGDVLGGTGESEGVLVVDLATNTDRNLLSMQQAVCECVCVCVSERERE